MKNPEVPQTTLKGTPTGEREVVPAQVELGFGSRPLVIVDVSRASDLT